MTVSELNLAAKANLESYFSNVSLTGELSRITMHASGHWYFDLKDEKAAIACAMFSFANQKLGFTPKQGDLLELFGKLSLYEASGRYQFIATGMKRSGEGDLEQRFLALKASLEKEGLFSKQGKLPSLPSQIGIICSPTSAALADMLRLYKIKGNFLAKLFIYPALTQGASAPESIISALKKADGKHDVLILARGGGSREDLFCFNDEELARCIYALKTPLISAIGHEIDYVISDFVADFRAPTPSAAINSLVISREDLEQNLDLLQNSLKEKLDLKIRLNEARLKHLDELLKTKGLGQKLNLLSQKLASLKEQLKGAMKLKILALEARLSNYSNLLEANEAFFKKSSKLVSVKVDEKVMNPQDLMVGMNVELVSCTRSFEAKILCEKKLKK